MECFRTSKYGQKLPNYRFSSKNSIIMRAHSLVMALYQDQNMSESSMGHYFENAHFRRRQGQSRTLKMQLKLTQTQVFYKKTPSTRTNSLFTGSYQNQNMSQSPRGNQLQKWTFNEKAVVVQNPQNAAKIDPNTFFL